MVDAASLDARGYAVVGGLLDKAECRALAALWADESAFRKRIIMQNHGYGQGERECLHGGLLGYEVARLGACATQISIWQQTATAHCKSRFRREHRYLQKNFCG